MGAARIGMRSDRIVSRPFPLSRSRGLDGIRGLILDPRGVPLVDTSGLQALARLYERLRRGASSFTTDRAIVEADCLQARSRGD